jgi:uncharacterized protein YndB with AHSA1/START domain
MEENNKHNLTITRLLDAPLDKVWQAWTDPDILKDWWGPRGVTNPICVWETKVRGDINIVMLAGEELGQLKGQEWPMNGQFVEVIPKSKLVFKSSALIDNKPIMEQLCTVTFEEQGDRTNLSIAINITKVTPEAEGPLAGMEIGWNQSIDKLKENLERSI